MAERWHEGKAFLNQKQSLGSVQGFEWGFPSYLSLELPGVKGLGHTASQNPLHCCLTLPQSVSNSNPMRGLPVSTSAQNHLYSSLLELCSLGTSLPPLPGLFLSLPYEQLGGVNGTVMNVEKAEIVAKEDFRPMVCIKPPAPSKGPPRRWCSACVVD